MKRGGPPAQSRPKSLCRHHPNLLSWWRPQYDAQATWRPVLTEAGTQLHNIEFLRQGLALARAVTYIHFTYALEVS